MVLLGAAAAVAATDARQQLSDADAGKITFLSAGSIVKAADRAPMAFRDAPVTLTGELRFPEGAGPFPAVVMAHGCAGIGFSDVTWVPVLLQWGYATFVVDSLGGRRIPSLCDDVSRLFPVQRVPDVYGALRLLATHPKIAADRLALMGWSHGGLVTLSAATAWARDTYAADGKPHFRAFFPFYPYCNAGVPEYDAISAPMRIHIGALDDWTPAKPCSDLAERLRSKGFDAETTVYPDAHHGFDDPFGATTKLPSVANVAACFPKYDSILGPSTLANPWAGCAKRGATVGRKPAAIQAARDALRPQLDELLAKR
jgi:dienelactone hydrolase